MKVLIIIIEYKVFAFFESNNFALRVLYVFNMRVTEDKH